MFRCPEVWHDPRSQSCWLAVHLRVCNLIRGEMQKLPSPRDLSYWAAVVMSHIHSSIVLVPTITIIRMSITIAMVTVIVRQSPSVISITVSVIMGSMSAPLQPSSHSSESTWWVSQRSLSRESFFTGTMWAWRTIVAGDQEVLTSLCKLLQAMRNFSSCNYLNNWRAATPPRVATAWAPFIDGDWEEGPRGVQISFSSLQELGWKSGTLCDQKEYN